MEEKTSPIQFSTPEPPEMQGVTSLVMPQDNNFGVQLQRARLDADLSIAEAAAKAHCSGTTIQRLEICDFTCIDDSPFFFRKLIERLGHAYELNEEEIDAIKMSFDADFQNYLTVSGRNVGQPSTSITVDDELPSHSRQRTSAFLITMLIVLLGVLILGGYSYKQYQRSRLKHAAQDYDLPSLIETPRLPMDVMPIPNS